jgi:hypothetical protein
VRKTIRVFFANCPHLDESAAAYLILSQNNVQTVFEFEVWHLSLYAEGKGLGNSWTKFLAWWSGSLLPLPWKRFVHRRQTAHMDRIAVPPLANILPLRTCVDTIRPFLRKNDEWITSYPAGTYGNWTIRPAPTVIITETPLEKGYFGWSTSDIAIACVGEWRRKYTPPSLLEFILDQVQRYALRLAIDERIGSHYPTRGCIWDFDANIEDAKISPLVGYLCDSCEQLVAERVAPDELQQIRRLLAHKWLGTTDEAGSVASNLKRIFGYDLARTRGLSSGFLDRVRETASSELVRLIAAAITGVAIFLFGLWVKKHGGGYPLNSPSPHRLWFAFRLPEVRVNDPVMGNRIDGHSLLRQAQEKFASTL